MPPKTQGLEQRFTGFLNGLYAHLLDLNLPMSQVAGECTQLMDQREQLLNMYGVVTAPALIMPGAAVMAAGAGAANISSMFRMKLQELASKKASKERPSKEDFVYTTEPAAENEKEWVCTVSSPLLSADFRSEAPQPSKKAAEQAAAEAALKADFPQAYAAMMMGTVPTAPQVQGQKRKAENGDEGPIEGKSGLSRVMSLLLERSVTKDDVVYTVAEDGSSFTATVSLPNYKGGKTFTGAAAVAKKDAEANAADAALKALASVIGPALEEHKAKKLRKKAEEQEKLAAKRAAQRAEKEAAKK